MSVSLCSAALLLGVAAIVGCMALSMADGAEGESVIRQAAISQDTTSMVIGTSGTQYAFSPKRPAYYGLDGNQYYAFGKALDSADPNQLAIYNDYAFSGVHHALRDPVPYEVFVFSASFALHAVQAKTRDHYYVAGNDGVDDVIEKWKRSNAIPSGGATQYAMKRSLLHRGDLGGIKSIGVDHLARYLLVVHDDSPTKVSRISLPTGTPQVILSGAAVPALNTRAESIFQRRHAAYGIVWTIESKIPLPDGSRDYVLLYDGQDDGNIEGHAVLSAQEYSELASASSPQWLDWFMND